MRPSITFKLTLARRSPTHRPKEPLRIMDEDGQGLTRNSAAGDMAHNLCAAIK